MATFFSLSAELHEMIFDFAMMGDNPLLSEHILSPSTLIVSKDYYSRALRSYYKHVHIAYHDTPAGRARFRAIPEELKKVITTMTFVDTKRRESTIGQHTVPYSDRENPDQELKRLAAVISQCPRLTDIKFESLVPWSSLKPPNSGLSDKSWVRVRQWWKVLQGIKNIIIPETHFHLRAFIEIRRRMATRGEATKGKQIRKAIRESPPIWRWLKGAVKINGRWMFED